MSATIALDGFSRLRARPEFARQKLAVLKPTTYQQLFIVSLVFEILLFPTIYFLRRNAKGDCDKSGHRQSAANFGFRMA